MTKAASDAALPLRLAATIAALALVAVWGLGVRAGSGTGHIRFVATQMDVTVAGEFGKFSAAIDFDPAKPETGKVNVDIDLASVATGSADADDLLKGGEFFDVAHFPRATFVSNALSATAPGRFQARGALTLKGRSADLVLPFTARPEGAGLRIEGGVPISRLAYKVGEGEWADTGTLADQVQLRFNLYVKP